MGNCPVWRRLVNPHRSAKNHPSIRNARGSLIFCASILFNNWSTSSYFDQGWLFGLASGVKSSIVVKQDYRSWQFFRFLYLKYPKFRYEIRNWYGRSKENDIQEEWEDIKKSWSKAWNRARKTWTKTRSSERWADATHGPGPRAAEPRI